jgi:pyruvate-ferredoxin/flavodoxin oxidoreductase
MFVDKRNERNNMNLEKKTILTMDGGTAAAYIAYAMSEVAGIYPITPSSPMAEIADKWASSGRKNVFGQVVSVTEMQSEAGASGVVHGSLSAGALTTTFTASQGLLLMIPNMYKMSGELLPAVFHVASRSLATHALSIFGDQQDVMATRATGFSMLSSCNVQEVMDMAAIAHLSAIKSSMPFMHFFDGFRTSHEIQKIETIGYETLRPLIDYKELDKFRKRALNPEHPIAKGTAQNPDVYFQNMELKNVYYQAIPDIVNDYMEKLGKETGRLYKPFEYYGAKNADRIIIAMGSVCDTTHETIDYLLKKKQKVGMITVHLYRPFSTKYLFNVLPKTVKKIAVIERTKEPGSIGEPLYLDITHALFKAGKNIEVVGGRYGLSSKDTTPDNILSVFENLEIKDSKDNFTIGINDDVSFTSLAVTTSINTTPKGTICAKFWGLGSDGTVGANKRAIKIIGDNTDMNAQAYFYYDSKKSGNITVSHLRFGKEKIRAPYYIKDADYIACHNSSFVNQFKLLEGLKEKGVFVLNCSWSDEELAKELPKDMKDYIIDKNIRFYTIDALKITDKIGLGSRINMVMQSAFFKLSKIIPLEEAVGYLKDGIKKAYGHKGENIVTMNYQAVDQGLKGLHKVKITDSWKYDFEVENDKNIPSFIKNVAFVMNSQQGDKLPVSAFTERPDGSFPLGTTKYEKRGIATVIPRWDVNACIQCNQCSMVCPHAVIRPFLLNEEELSRAPETFETKVPLGKQFEGLKFRIQVSPLDCTGCGNCADICPAPGKALFMEPLSDQVEVEKKNWEFSETVTYKDNLMSKEIFKGSQFAQPLLQFSGACPGCGETAYVKLVTQLFGEKMIIANATGCSSIWGANSSSIAYDTNADGRGPAWANSLFEDNAEYGYGMRIATKQRRNRLLEVVDKLAKETTNTKLKEAIADYAENRNDSSKSRIVSDKLVEVINKQKKTNEETKYIIDNKDMLADISQWIVGGDGWAYDIGYGGLDHVLASGENVNVLVMDTEVYSNTGGQSSKATPTAAVAKFASSGKKIRKKDLGAMAITYGYVYVAQIAIGANMIQATKALVEAEKYDGPSLIIAYSPCIEHGIKVGMGKSVNREKLAVQSGYWHLYRHNPTNVEKGENPFTLDSKKPNLSFRDFLMGEVRYTSLLSAFPDTAEELFTKSEKDAKSRLEYYERLAEK